MGDNRTGLQLRTIHQRSEALWYDRTTTIRKHCFKENLSDNFMKFKMLRAVFFYGSFNETFMEFACCKKHSKKRSENEVEETFLLSSSNHQSNIRPSSSPPPPPSSSSTCLLFAIQYSTASHSIIH